MIDITPVRGPAFFCTAQTHSGRFRRLEPVSGGRFAGQTPENPGRLPDQRPVRAAIARPPVFAAPGVSSRSEWGMQGPWCRFQLQSARALAPGRCGGCAGGIGRTGCTEIGHCTQSASHWVRAQRALTVRCVAGKACIGHGLLAHGPKALPPSVLRGRHTAANKHTVVRCCG